MVFPDAIILHTMRDPLDTLFSCFRCKFDDSGLEWSLDVSDLVLQYVLYLQIMQHFRTVLPGRVVDVRYVGETCIYFLRRAVQVACLGAYFLRPALLHDLLMDTNFVVFPSQRFLSP